MWDRQAVMVEEFAINEWAAMTKSSGGHTVLMNERDRLARQFAVKGHSIGFGIALAGAAYPCVVAIILFLQAVVGLNPFPRVDPGPNEVEEALTFGFYACTIGALVSLLWATIVCIIVLPLVYFVVLSLKLTGSLTRLGAFAGGLVGFVATIPLVLDAFRYSQSTTATVLPLIAFPGLTTVLGQVGGAWGALRVVRTAEALTNQAVESAGTSNTSPVPMQPSRFQFGMRHLLWAGIWVSLVLTTIRLLGARFDVVLPLLVGWLVYQTATLWIGGLPSARFRRWGAGRQTRST